MLQSNPFYVLFFLNVHLIRKKFVWIKNLCQMSPDRQQQQHRQKNH